MIEQPLEDLLARLDRERLDADRRYNEALTAVNQAIQRVPPLPSAPPAPDDTNLERLNKAWRIRMEDFSTEPSSETGWRGRLRGVVRRLIDPPAATRRKAWARLERQEHFNAAIVEHVNRNLASARETPAATAEVILALRQALEGLYRFQSLLVQYLMTITAFVDTRDRRLGAEGIAERLQFVERRLVALGGELDRLHRNQPAAPITRATADPGDSREAFASPLASVTYVGFEDRFRGTREDIAARVQHYVPLLSGAKDVLDVGCGRGEMLEALRQRGVTARGVDTNHAMVELCRARGLDVDESDALAFLQRQAPECVGGLVAIQVVEHFAPAYLTAFLTAAHDAMAPGAPLVLETINPACWAAFFETYIRDLTHQRPLHPDTLRYLVQASGFRDVDIQFRQPVRDADRLDHVSSLARDAGAPAIDAIVAAINDHADKLNARLFSSFDYAVIARR
ncbi:MAG: class I SAM-dependent methyltransferase [Acidimicrobiia bacterium]|nr:class I SAM-dependent methyltransferase [Acidimicrobiia bacterium]